MTYAFAFFVILKTRRNGFPRRNGFSRERISPRLVQSSRLNQQRGNKRNWL